MAIRSVRRELFSVFKKKCQPIEQQNYDSYLELYQSLSAFESDLDDLELKKMPKKLEHFSKRFRRLSKVDG